VYLHRRAGRICVRHAEADGGQEAQEGGCGLKFVGVKFVGYVCGSRLWGSGLWVKFVGVMFVV
jgi:hypothetical protein